MFQNGVFMILGENSFNVSIADVSCFLTRKYYKLLFRKRTGNTEKETI